MRSDLRFLLVLVLVLAAGGTGCAKPSPGDVLVDEAARTFALQASCPAL